MENSNNSSDRDILLSIYSDVHKDVYGFRPRGAAFPSDLSDEEIQAKLDDLQARLDAEMEEERYEEERSLYEDFYGVDLGEDGDGWR